MNTSFAERELISFDNCEKNAAHIQLKSKPRGSGNWVKQHSERQETQ
jgi:hypothetical protein